MKKQGLFTIAIFFITIFNSLACEICGCSHSNFQIGLLPTFNKGFMGLRYSFSTFKSRMKDDPSEFSQDYYQTVELWGGYNYRKLQVMTFMPYAISRKESDDGVTNSSGIGDLMVLINYKLFSATSLSKNEKTFRNEFFVGGGIKLPTGVSQVNLAGPEFNIGDFNSQAGTGSVDYMLNVTHNFMWNNSGIVTNLAYRFNSVNQQDYKFGNRVYLNSSYFYTFTKVSTKIKPNAGFNYQSNRVNEFKSAEVEDSNGYNLNSTVGVNVLHKKIGINAMIFIPMTQNNYDGQTKLKSRCLFGLTYSI